jgi:hypothetical protein
MKRKLTLVLREEGPAAVLRRAIALVYRRGIRPILPVTGHVRYAGIPVAYTRRAGDRTIPPTWRPRTAEDQPGYEAALVVALREVVQPGDHVVVVGGGVGVTATVAAIAAGPNGRVTCFEGSREHVDLVRRTASINGVTGRLSVRHAVVARAVRVYGTQPGHAVVAPTELPVCDVLELDCEGAEVDILREMAVRPREILVETHGMVGASTPIVSDLLSRAGYGVRDAGVAEPRAKAFCDENDIRVLIGTREDGPAA